MYISQKLQIRPNNVQKTIIEHCFNLYRSLYNSMAKVINKRLKENKFVAFSKYEHYFIEKSKTPKMEYLKDYGQEFFDQVIKNISRSYSALKASASKEERQIRLKNDAGYKKAMIGSKNVMIVHKDGAKYPYLKINKCPTPIRLNKPLRFSGRLNRVYLSCVGSKYFVTLCYTVSDKDYKTTHKHLFTRTKRYIGVDVGVVNNVTLSNGISLDFYHNVEHLNKKIKVLSRIIGEMRGHLKSKNLTTSIKLRKYQQMLSKAYLKKSLIIKDSLNKLTTNLVKLYDAICVEDLSIDDFMKKSSLAKAFGSLSFGLLKNQLLQKCNDVNFKKVVFANRFYPSSKKCSHCDTINALDDITNRVYECKTCGSKIDRDLNAAINLYKYMISILGLVRPDVKAEKVHILEENFAKQGFFVKNLSTQGSS